MGAPIWGYNIAVRTNLGGCEMGLSLVQSRALRGLDAAKVTVEVHLANGLPSFTNLVS